MGGYTTCRSTDGMTGDDADSEEDAHTASGQRDRWCAYRRTVTGRTATPFAGYRWPRASIALAVHWSCR